MRADAEFQCPPDFLVYPHDGSVIHPPQAWSPSSSAQQPIRQTVAGGRALHCAANSPDPRVLARLPAALPPEAQQRLQIPDAVDACGDTALH